MEIEAKRVRMDSEELYSKVYDLAHYLLVNGPVVADGDTVGSSDSERIKVRFKPSIWDSSMQVYRLEFPD